MAVLVRREPLLLEHRLLYLLWNPRAVVGDIDDDGVVGDRRAHAYLRRRPVVVDDGVCQDVPEQRGEEVVGRDGHVGDVAGH